MYEFELCKSKPEYYWINKFLYCCFKEYSVNKIFHENIKYIVLKQINKDLPPFLGVFTMPEFAITKEAPCIKNIFVRKSEPFEMLADIEISYEGKIH